MEDRDPFGVVDLGEEVAALEKSIAERLRAAEENSYKIRLIIDAILALSSKYPSGEQRHVLSLLQLVDDQVHLLRLRRYLRILDRNDQKPLSRSINLPDAHCPKPEEPPE